MLVSGHLQKFTEPIANRSVSFCCEFKHVDRTVCEILPFLKRWCGFLRFSRFSRFPRGGNCGYRRYVIKLMVECEIYDVISRSPLTPHNRFRGA